MFCFSQCKKDSPSVKKEGVKRGDIKLTNAELKIIPYVANDSIIFNDSLGNSHIFKVLSLNTTSPRVYKDGATDASTDYYNIEELIVSLSDNNGYDIRINLRAPLPSYCSNQSINKNYFIVSFYPSYNSIPTISYNFFANYIDTADFYYTSHGISIPYHTSITLANKTFNSVYELTYTKPYGSDDYVQTAYYNKSKGIVGFKMKSGEIWYLKN